jgi:hypothetical protein
VTTKEFNRIGRALLPDFPELALQGRLLYMPPVESLLHGILFDSSGFSKTPFYVNVFVMPLFVPSRHLTLSYGNRLESPTKPDGWDSHRPNLVPDLRDAIRSEAIPFLATMRAPGDFIRYLRNHRVEDIRSLEALGYALAHSGLVKEAIQALKKIEPYVDMSIPWQTDVLFQTSEFRKKISANPSSAQEILRNIERETRKHLKLPDISIERYPCSTPS